MNVGGCSLAPLGTFEGKVPAEVMAKLKGRAILTINDHPDMRRVYAGFNTETMRTTYTVGGGGRAKPVGELLIRTW